MSHDAAPALDSARRGAFVAGIRPEPVAVGALCDAADAYVAERGGGDRSRYALRLVLEELLVNIARYASATGDVAVRVETDAGTIRVRIDDDGVPFDPTAVAPPAAPTSLVSAPVGGLGLKMVRSSVRRFGYRREGGRNVVEAEIPLAGA